MLRKYKVSAGLYILIILCFLLPFVTVSCAGSEVVTLTGMDLVAGTTIDGHSLDPYPFAVAMLGIAIVGVILGLGLWKSKACDIMSALLAMGGLVTTILAKFGIDGEVAKEGQGSFQASYQSGFYVLLFLYLATAAYNLVLYKKEPIDGTDNKSNKRQTNKSTNKPINKIATGNTPSTITCTSCGSLNKDTDAFCSHCGAKIIQPTKQDGKVCKSCGMLDKMNGRFCVNCGASLTEKVNLPSTPVPVEDKPDIAATTELVYTEPLAPIEIPVIKVIKGDDEDVIAITKPEFVIGRNPEEVDYVISNSSHIGRKHAKIVLVNESYHLTDLCSKNGTFLNGDRIDSEKPYLLNYGDKIMLANIELAFEKM